MKQSRGIVEGAWKEVCGVKQEKIKDGGRVRVSCLLISNLKIETLRTLVVLLLI